MDFAQSKINQKLEEALFSWEEQRLFQKEIPLESLLLSYPALNKELPKAIKELQEMDWLLYPDSEPISESFSDNDGR